MTFLETHKVDVEAYLVAVATDGIDELEVVFAGGGIAVEGGRNVGAHADAQRIASLDGEGVAVPGVSVNKGAEGDVLGVDSKTFCGREDEVDVVVGGG